MLSCTVPSGVRKIADRYKDIFTSESGNYTTLCALLYYFLFGLEGLSELARTTAWSSSVSELSRSVHLFNANRYMRRLRQKIFRHYDGKLDPHNFVFAVDDTSNPRYGKKIFGAASWTSSTGPFFGQKILVVTLVDKARKIALPVAYAVLLKKTDKDYQKAHDVATNLLEEVCDRHAFPKLPVTTDSWFDSAEFMEELEKRSFTFVGEIKSNRKVKTNPSPFAKWGSLKNIFDGKRRIRARTCFDIANLVKRKKKGKCLAQTRLFIRKRNKALNAIAVYNRRNGKDAFAYYASTDLSMSGTTIWEISRSRWRIECLFRDLKQNLSFGRLSCKGENASDLAICIPFLLITSLRLDDLEEVWSLANADALSVGECVRRIREMHLSHSITVLVNRDDPDLKNRIKARRSLTTLNRKPVLKAAEAA